jgi:hypothetical protein
MFLALIQMPENVKMYDLTTRSNPTSRSLKRVLLRTKRFAKENPLIVVAGASALGLGAVLLVRHLVYKQPLVIYQDTGPGSGEIRSVAQGIAGRLATTAVGVSNAADFLEVIRSKSYVSPLVIVGHGTGRALLRPGASGIQADIQDNLPSWISLTTAANELARVLAPNFVIGINACKTGANWRTSEQVDVYSSGGERGFAAKLRDALVDAGAHSGEIRANAAIGIHGNPTGRIFYVSPRYKGTPGISLLESKWGEGAARDRTLRGAWPAAVRGEMALRWMAGGDFNVPRPA